MKTTKIIYWVTTTLIFLFEGVMPALTGHSEMSIEGITHLGYPLYFVTLLVVFKVLGAVCLLIPQVPSRVKEWAYAGFAFNLISAFVSHWFVDGLSAMSCFPLIVFVVVIVSYITYHKIEESK
jgi:hypothetical protein